MKKKLLTIGLISLTALGMASCGDTASTNNSGNQNITEGPSQSLLKQAKAELKTTFEEIASELGVSATNGQEYYNRLKNIYENGLTAIGEASTDGVVNSTLKSYKNRLSAEKDAINAEKEQIEFEGLKANRISIIESIAKQMLEAEGLSEDNAPEGYSTILSDSKAIIQNCNNRNNLNTAYLAAKNKVETELTALLADSTVIINKRIDAINELKDYYQTKVNAGFVDDGSVYTVLSKSIKAIYSYANSSLIDNEVVNSKNKMDQAAMSADNSLLSYVTGSVVLANKFTNPDMVVDCIGGDDVLSEGEKNDELYYNLYEIYGRCYQYSEASNKGTKTYFDDYYTEQQNLEAQIKVTEADGLFMDDNSSDSSVSGYGLETNIDFEDINSNNADSFRIHFETKYTEASSWSIYKLFDSSNNDVLEIGATKGIKTFGYRLGSSGDRLQIGETGIANGTNNGFASVDIIYDFTTNELKITVNNGVTTQTVNTTATISSASKIVIDGNGASAREVYTKNLVISKTAKGSSAEALATAKAAACSELDSYASGELTVQGKEDDGTVAAEITAQKALINEASSLTAVEAALTTAKTEVKAKIDAISSGSSEDTELVSAKSNACSELDNYASGELTAQGKEDDGTVAAEITTQKELINAATSIEEVETALTTAKTEVKAKIDAITIVEVNKYTLNPSDITTSTKEVAYEVETPISNTPFTLIGASGKPINVKNDRIALSKGAAKTSQNSIKIEVSKPGLLTFTASSTKANTKAADTTSAAKAASALANKFVLLNASGTKAYETSEYAVTTSIDGYNNVTYSIYIEEAGTYYFGGSASGVYIYNLELDYTKTASDVVSPSLEVVIANYKDMLACYNLTLVALNPDLADTLNTEVTAQQALIGAKTTSAEAKTAYEAAIEALNALCTTLATA